MKKNVIGYLKEWSDEQERAKKFARNPVWRFEQAIADALAVKGINMRWRIFPNFSWKYHDDELISIRRAINACYSQMDARARAALSKTEMDEIMAILECEID